MLGVDPSGCLPIHRMSVACTPTTHPPTQPVRSELATKLAVYLLITHSTRSTSAAITPLPLQRRHFAPPTGGESVTPQTQLHPPPPDKEEWNKGREQSRLSPNESDLLPICFSPPASPPVVPALDRGRCCCVVYFKTPFLLSLLFLSLRLSAVQISLLIKLSIVLICWARGIC